MCVVLKFIRGHLNVCGLEVHKGGIQMCVVLKFIRGHLNVCGPEVHKGEAKCVWS